MGAPPLRRAGSLSHDNSPNGSLPSSSSGAERTGARGSAGGRPLHAPAGGDRGTDESFLFTAFEATGRNNVVQAHRAPAFYHEEDDQRQAQYEVFDPLASLVSKPVHEETVLTVYHHPSDVEKLGTVPRLKRAKGGKV